MSCAADSTVIETKVLYMVFLDTDDFELKHPCFLYNSLLLEMRRAYFLLKKQPSERSGGSDRKCSIVSIRCVASGKAHCTKKGSFPSKISSVNVSESPFSCGFGCIYRRNP